MKAIIKLIRPINCLMAGIGAIIGALIVVNLNIDFLEPILLVFLGTVFVTAGGNALNDYFDPGVDAVSHKERPIPSGQVHLQTALKLSLSFFLIGIVLAFLINIVCLVIAVINVFFLLGYEKYLKGKGLVGNLAIAYLVGSVFLIGGAAVGNIWPTLILAILAFLVTLGREIIKDIKDIDGDTGKRMTFPMRVGERKAKIASASSIGLAVLLSYSLWLWEILGADGLPYVAIVVADAFFTMSLFALVWNIRITDKLLKIGMGLALAALVLGGTL